MKGLKTFFGIGKKTETPPPTSNNTPPPPPLVSIPLINPSLEKEVVTIKKPTLHKPDSFLTLLQQGEPKFGLFCNTLSFTVAEQLGHLGYDWILIDLQHGPMNSKKLSLLLCAIASSGAKSMVRITSPQDRVGIQQALDLGADGILIPYVNNATEVKNAINSCLYPPHGSRSVYFPQRCTNKEGLLGYIDSYKPIIAIQIETANSIHNISEISSIKEVDILFLGQNDLCMSLGLYETYEFPKMYTSNELNEATNALILNAKKYNKILGIFLFGTDRVQEFLSKGFTFISIGNDLHHLVTQSQTYFKSLNDEKKSLNETSLAIIRTTRRYSVMESCPQILIHPFVLKSIVVEGFKRGGKELGFPTANLDASTELDHIPIGVYAGWVKLNEVCYPAAISVGWNPTYPGNKRKTCEPHVIHQFKNDFYGSEIIVLLAAFIRNELAFESIKELKAAIEQDIQISLLCLEKSEFLQAKQLL
jgi:4-hydroxy-2-oxoheptanedioate aldolase